MVVIVIVIFLQMLKKNSSNMEKFEEFISKEIFLLVSNSFYPGICVEKFKPIVTEVINESAKDFQNIAVKGIASDNDYHKAIEKGLNRFSKIYLESDTENLERICTYFEELMDIVGLESSGGLLNEFMYGYDFSE